MAGTAIIRVEKYKSFSDLRGVLGHHLRTLPTSNADAERTAENQVIFGGGDVRGIINKVKSITDPLSKRKDSVRAVELFLGASDEFWESGGDWTALGRAHLANLKAEFGEQNIIGMGVHLDETRPHFWAIVTPVHDGKLRAAHWFDGPKKLSEFQTRSAERMAHIGLGRGRMRTRGTHVDVRTWHQAQAGNKAAQKMLEAEQKRRTNDAEERARKAEVLARDMQKEAQILKTANEFSKAQADDILKRARTMAWQMVNRKKTIEEALQKEREALAKERKRLGDLAASLKPIEEERAAAALAEIKVRDSGKNAVKATTTHALQHYPDRAAPSVRKKNSPGG